MPGDYDKARTLGLHVYVLLFETLGGFSPDVVKVLSLAAAEVDNRLTRAQYDETTWSARKYLPFAMQRISVAAHLAMAQEVAEALGLSVAADPRAC